MTDYSSNRCLGPINVMNVEKDSIKNITVRVQIIRVRCVFVQKQIYDCTSIFIPMKIVIMNFVTGKTMLIILT